MKILFLSILFLCSLCSTSTILIAQKNTPIIFVHGMLASGDTWQRPIAHFKANGYTEEELIVMDWNTLDFNRSNAVTQLEELIDVTRKKSGVKRVILVGHSAGGGVCMSYLSENKKSTKKVEGYIHVASFPITTAPSVPTLNLYSPDDKITGGKDADGVENKSIPGLDHYEIATSALSFEAMYAFLYGSETKPKPLPALEQDVYVKGKVCTLGENNAEESATIHVFKIDEQTKEWNEEEVLYSITSDKDGRWEIPSTLTNASYVFKVVPKDNSKRTIYYIKPAFQYADNFIYLRILPSTGMASMLLGNLPSNNEESVLAIFSANSAVIHDRDTLTLNSTLLSDSIHATASKTPIAFFVSGDSTFTKNLQNVPFMVGFQKEIKPNTKLAAQLNDTELEFTSISSEKGIMVIIFD